jgi:hypothetical protein
MKSLRYAAAAVALLLLATGYIVLERAPPTRAAEPRTAGPQIILFSEENFQGEQLVITQSMFDLPVVRVPSGEDIDWNDRAQSVLVLGGTWRLYQHGRFNTALDDTAPEVFRAQAKPPRSGWSCIVSAQAVSELAIPSVAHGGLFWDISSVELISAQNLPDWVFEMRK